MNHAELQLRLSCVHGRYAAKTCDTQQNRKMLTMCFWDMRMLRGKLKSFVFLATCAPDNSRENKSIYDLYAQCNAVRLSHFSAYFCSICKRVFTHADWCVTFQFNTKFNVAKALQVFDMDSFWCPSATGVEINKCKTAVAVVLCANICSHALSIQLSYHEYRWENVLRQNAGR